MATRLVVAEVQVIAPSTPKVPVVALLLTSWQRVHVSAVAAAVAAVLKALEAQAETRLFPAAVQVKVASAAAFWKPIPQAVQTFAAEAYDPAAQVAVHVSVPQSYAASAVKVFASVPALHKPVAKRLLVAVVQVKVASSAAPATAVHLVHAPAFCCLLYQKKSTVKREKQDLEDNILICMCVVRLC